MVIQMKNFILFLLICTLGSIAQDTLSQDNAETTPPQTEVQKEQSGIRIIGTPDSISVKIDGKFRGHTPITITDILPGEHSIILTKKGYYGKKLSTTVIEDSLIEIVSELRAPATLTVTSTPDSALLFINKKKMDKTPYTATPLRPGSYSVMLLRGGYAKYDTTVELTSGEVATLNASMKSLSAGTSETQTDSLSENEKKFVKKESVENDTKQKDSGEDKKRKKIFTIIGSAIFAAFLSVIVTSEFSGSEL